MRILAILMILAMVACTPKNSENKESDESNVLNLYSQRHYDSDKKVFDLFSEKTGIQINLINQGLMS
ncbi:MAG: hypothetical protein GY816_18555 [Cytophagales bacterium]|nr:hypothetical protein [Cytophagales bacterium]